MIPMIGKDIRRRAFAGVIASASLAIALALALGAVFAGALLLPHENSAGETEWHASGAAAMKSGAATLYDPERDGEVIRLHIVANSDSSEDQRVKLLVRDAVLALAHLNDDVLHPQNAAAAELLLKNAGMTLLDTVRSTLEREGAGYDAQLILGDFDFPDREYGGKLYPAGKYRALRILLGQAEGKNWWCILFPPLCIIKAEERTVANGTEQGAYADEAAGGNCSNAQRDGTVRFESLFVRLFNRVFYGEE